LRDRRPAFGIATSKEQRNILRANVGPLHKQLIPEINSKILEWRIAKNQGV